MAIPEQLQNELSKGDFTRIANLYTYKTGRPITNTYVSMVIRGLRNNEEIIEIAELYIEAILDLKRKLVEFSSEAA